jgi:zinc D-Ala-D-Ala dipeptidase
MGNKKVLMTISLFTVLFLPGCFSNSEELSAEIDTLQSQIVELEQATDLINKEKEALLNEIQEINTEKNTLITKIESNEKNRIAQLSKITGLVNMVDIDHTIVIDLRYATSDNFVGEKVYSNAICLLREETAFKLKKANELAKEKGYRIKIWDGYRPLDVQKTFWEKTPDPRYVSDPKKGTDHNRGAAVDITLVDKDGNEVEMPTGFDEFSEKAWRNYQGNTTEAQKNMEFLTNIMVESGFTTIRTEWWHYVDSQAKNYPFQNVQLEYFVSKTN